MTSATPIEQRAYVRGVELRARALERRRGHTARRAHPEREREQRRGLHQRGHARHPEHVRDLVGVGRDGGGPPRQHAADELVDPELGGLEVHVRVDEARCERGPADVDGLHGLAGAPADDRAVGDREVGVEPPARR
jgi:hypothetical protein